jgi:flagellar motor switch/type III secretory pathway protein FliN
LDAPLPLTGLALCDWPELHPGAASSDDEATVSPDALCEVKVVLGRAALGGGAPQRLPIGQIVVLDSAAQAPVEIWSGGQLVARGQLRTLDGHYCVQVNELLHPLARKRRP